MNTEPQSIDWRIIRANKKDVEYAKQEGEKIKINDELFRDAVSIGPLAIDHNHCSGYHISGTRKQIEMASRCEQMFELLKGYCNNIMGFSDIKFLEEASQIVKEIEQYDTPTAQG